jgi:hypothetical protein
MISSSRHGSASLFHCYTLNMEVLHPSETSLIIYYRQDVTSQKTRTFANSAVSQISHGSLPANTDFLCAVSLDRKSCSSVRKVHSCRFVRETGSTTWVTYWWKREAVSCEHKREMTGTNTEKHHKISFFTSSHGTLVLRVASILSVSTLSWPVIMHDPSCVYITLACHNAGPFVSLR